MRKSFAALLTCTLVGLFSAGALAQELVLKTGDAAPDFKATATAGTEVSLETFKEADVLVMLFTCNSCPIAEAYEQRFIDFVKKYEDQKVQLVAINNRSGENVEVMAEYAKEKGFNFVYAYEGAGDSARAYGARVTPHLFVFDSERKLQYQGAFDDSFQAEPSEHYVIDVVDALLKGETVPVEHKRAFGCAIKLASE